VSGAVLVPPTGNRVLNQIPAGDSRESSREQAVLDDGAPFPQGRLSQGRETISPKETHTWTWRQSRLPDPQKKKKKKKWREAEVGPDHYFHVVPTGQPLSSTGACHLSEWAKGGHRKLEVNGGTRPAALW